MSKEMNIKEVNFTFDIDILRKPHKFQLILCADRALPLDIFPISFITDDEMKAFYDHVIGLLKDAEVLQCDPPAFCKKVFVGNVKVCSADLKLFFEMGEFRFKGKVPANLQDRFIFEVCKGMTEVC